MRGGRPLNGTVRVSGAKNAALPMLCACLLTTEKCTLRNVPEISDVAILLDVFRTLGADVSWDKSTKVVTVEAKNIDPKKLETCEELKKLRATILLLGPLLARFGNCKIVRPGGDIIGARPNFIHTDGLETLGCELIEEGKFLHMTWDQKRLKKQRLLLSEASVTGTENIALFLAGQPDTAEIYFAAAEPHVQATLRMLQKMGASIEGIGTHHLRIWGRKELRGVDVTLPPDGILVGTYMIAGAITGGDVTVQGVDHTELYSFYGPLKRIGVNFEMLEDAVRVRPPHTLTAIPKVQTAIYPGFSSDLQSLVGVLLTQCEGTTTIFETLYEGRLTYLQELEKMGAQVEIVSPHRAKITGPTKLKGTEVQSWDLRAGAAVVLAGLVAEGETIVDTINYIDRGYEAFEETLMSLGADIERITT